MKRLIDQVDLKAIIRFVNIAILLMFSLVFVSILIDNEDIALSLNGISIIVILVLPPFISHFILWALKNNIHFYEWDLRERMKKSEFLITVSGDVHFFCFLSVILLTLTITHSVRYEVSEAPDLLILLLGLFFGILLMLNALFPVYLHRYKSMLEDTRNLTDRPPNWECGNASEKTYRNPPWVSWP